MTNDLQEARESAAAKAIRERSTWASMHWPNITGVNHIDVSTALAKAALAAADAHLPSVEEIAEVIRDDGWTCDFHEPDVGCPQCKRVHEATARKIAALFGEVAGDE